MQKYKMRDLKQQSFFMYVVQLNNLQLNNKLIYLRLIRFEHIFECATSVNLHCQR